MSSDLVHLTNRHLIDFDTAILALRVVSLTRWQFMHGFAFAFALPCTGRIAGFDKLVSGFLEVSLFTISANSRFLKCFGVSTLDFGPPISGCKTGI